LVTDEADLRVQLAFVTAVGCGFVGAMSLVSGVTMRFAPPRGEEAAFSTAEFKQLGAG
jgi:hypothetical protein